MNNLENKKLNNQEIEDGKLVLKSYPQEIWLSITNKCNLNCSHCKLGTPERENMRHAGRVDMSDELFEKIKKQVFPHINKVVFGGNELSEQLSSKKWDYIFNETAKFPMDIHIVSNGTLLTEERIRKFIEREVTLSISVESCNRELYEIMRGKNYDKVFNMVKYGCELKKKLKKDKAVIKFGVTLFRDNIYELPEMIEFASEIGASEINSNYFCPHFEYQRDQALVYHKDIYNQIYDIAMAKASKLGMPLSMPPKFYIPKINEKNIEKSLICDKKNNECYLPWDVVSIDQEGKVIPCSGVTFIMGDLKKEDFFDVWNCKKYQNLRSSVNSKHPTDYCNNCLIRGDGKVPDSSVLSAIGMGGGHSIKRMLLLNIRSKMLKNKITKPAYFILEKIYKKIA